MYQEVNLATNLSVAENMMLGREPPSLRRASTGRTMRRRTAEVLEQLHLDIDPGSPLESHSIAVQQLVSIARAMEVDAQVLVLDEPTSSLDTHEVDELFEVVERVRASGVAVLFVTHFLDQVYRISDRITVLRNGRLVGEYLTAELPRLQLVSKMIGRELAVLDALEHEVQRAPTRRGAPPTFLAATGSAARQRSRRSTSRCATARWSAWPGCSAPDAPRRRACCSAPTAPTAATVDDRGPSRSGCAARASPSPTGIAFASENRRTEGLVGDLSVRANIVLAMQSARGWARAIPRRQQAELADRYIKALDIRPTDPGGDRRATCPAATSRRCCSPAGCSRRPSCCILDEPTRGIDVGAKAEIQRLVAALADDGMSVLFISAELEEVLRLSHRIVVMRDRHKVAEIDNRGHHGRAT